MGIRDNWGRLNINMSSYPYRDPHVKDKMEIPIPGKDGFYIEMGPRPPNHQTWFNSYGYMSIAWKCFISLATYLLIAQILTQANNKRDDVIKWKIFPCNRPFVWGIHQSPVNSPHKGSVIQTLMFLWCWSSYKLLNKPSNDWWFKTTWRSYDVIIMKTNKALHCWLFFRGFHNWLVDSTYSDAEIISMAWFHH